MESKIFYVSGVYLKIPLKKREKPENFDSENRIPKLSKTSRSESMCFTEKRGRPIQILREKN